MKPSPRKVKKAASRARQAAHIAPVIEGAAEAIRPGRRIVTRSEQRERAILVEQMWHLGWSPANIERQMRAQFGMGRQATLRLFEDVVQKGVAAIDSQRATWKAQDMGRLFKQLRAAMEAKNHMAVARIEELLMRMRGTAEPVRVAAEVQVTAALAQVVLSMRPEEVNALAERYAEVEERAQLYDAAIKAAE
jgi:hypothetical protein